MDEIKNFDDVVGLVNSMVIKFYSNHGYSLSDKDGEDIARIVLGMLKNKSIGFCCQTCEIDGVMLIIEKDKFMIKINITSPYGRSYYGKYIIDLSTLF